MARWQRRHRLLGEPTDQLLPRNLQGVGTDAHGRPRIHRHGHRRGSSVAHAAGKSLIEPRRIGRAQSFTLDAFAVPKPRLIGYRRGKVQLATHESLGVRPQDIRGNSTARFIDHQLELLPSHGRYLFPVRLARQQLAHNGL